MAQIDASALSSLLSQNETEVLEFKAGIPETAHLARHVASMANSRGGTIIVGVRGREVFGIDSVRLTECYENALTQLKPRPQSSVQFIEQNGKMVGIIAIEKSSTPIVFDKRIYVRSGSSTLVAVSDQSQGSAKQKPSALRLFAGITGLLSGAVVVLEILAKDSALSLINRHIVGSISGGIFLIALAYGLYDNQRKAQHERRFIDIDLSSRDDRLRRQISLLQAQLRQQQATLAKSTSKIENLTKQEIASQTNQQHGFSLHFRNMTTTLEDKAATADKKASALLDRGIIYIKFGIVFYIFSIIIWQLLAWYKGFQYQFIYGIIASSVLFVFIEFISAWFLKQYRQFVDTSTYLIKVKSMFDKHMLLFQMAVDMETYNLKNESFTALTDALKDDIRWPESYLLKNPDAGFVQEFMNSLTEVARVLTEMKKSDKAEKSEKIDKSDKSDKVDKSE